MQTQFSRRAPVRSGVIINDAFWNERLDRFFNVTLADSFDKFERVHAPDNFDNLENADIAHNGHPFFDGLLYEMIRGAADYLKRRPSAALEARLDGYIARIERAQAVSGDGFISTFTQRKQPEHRLGANGGNILGQHDTYNMGCLIEAGVHYYQATGKQALLACALRSANYLHGIVGPAPRKNVSPGHSMIEGALIELYDLCEADSSISEKTGVTVDAAGYLELAHSFVHMHGRYENRLSWPQYMGEYAQDHAPIELQQEAVGHAVRATLFYRGAAMLADRENDTELMGHVARLWRNVVDKKMYLNGGVGATHFEEKFALAYQLPNTGYMETCATVGLMLWASDMECALGGSEYADVFERCLFNLMLSSVSQAGTFYFYKNPLSSKGSDHRWAWHDCPCCPPMIHKLIGSLEEHIYSADERGIFVDQYIGSTVKASGLSLAMEGDYPYGGNVRIKIREASEGTVALRLRVPYWCRKWRVELNGGALAPEIEAGYAVINRAFKRGDEISLYMEMPVERVEAHPYVHDDEGRVAVTRGPLIYCFEGVDNAGDTERTLAADWRPAVSVDGALFGGTPVIDARDTEGRDFHAIPLFLWDNRAAGSMNAWVRQDGKTPVPVASADWEGALYRPYVPAASMSVTRLREHPELTQKAASWFHEKWGIPEAAYLESIRECQQGDQAVPQWYVVLDGERIIAGLGVIENDFHPRKDLSPNVCAVYVEADYRRRGIAGKLLNFACGELAETGIREAYLATSHVGFYERYGWEFFCMVQCDGDDVPSRMYRHVVK